MIELIAIAVGGLLLYSLILWIASKIRRRYRQKKALKENDYSITFM